MSAVRRWTCPIVTPGSIGRGARACGVMLPWVSVLMHGVCLTRIARRPLRLSLREPWVTTRCTHDAGAERARRPPGDVEGETSCREDHRGRFRGDECYPVPHHRDRHPGPHGPAAVVQVALDGG